MFLTLAALNLIDALATAHGVHLGYVEEKNPLMLALMEIAGLGGFLFVKGLVSVLMMKLHFFVKGWDLKPVTWLVRFAVVCYSLLTALHTYNVATWMMEWTG